VSNRDTLCFVSRTYTLKARAQRQDETRQRIVDAAVELHQTIGPDATTITDVAERAGVGRVTVYRHFPDELALLRACSGHFFAQHPFPDIDRWRAIDDRDERAKRGVREAYAWFRATDAMLSKTLPARREHEIFAPYHAHWREAAKVLARPRADKLARAAAALALSYDTWRTLTREGLTDAQAAQVAVGLAAEET
jgi:AcrR family transcriptional regulator